MLQELIATIATSLVVLGYIPQIIKSYRTKSVEDISYGFLFIIGLGTILWTVYGFIIADDVFIIAELVITVFVAILSVLKIKYDKRSIIRAERIASA